MSEENYRIKCGRLEMEKHVLLGNYKDLSEKFERAIVRVNELCETIRKYEHETETIQEMKAELRSERHRIEVWKQRCEMLEKQLKRHESDETKKESAE